MMTRSPAARKNAKQQIQVQIQTKMKDQSDTFQNSEMKLDNSSHINVRDVKANNLASRRASGPVVYASSGQPAYSAVRGNQGPDERSGSRMVTSPSGHPIKANLIHGIGNMNSKNAALRIDDNRAMALRYHNL